MASRDRAPGYRAWLSLTPAAGGRGSAGTHQVQPLEARRRGVAVGSRRGWSHGHPQLLLASARDEGCCLKNAAPPPKKNAAPTVLVLPFPGDSEQLLPLRQDTPTQLSVLRSSWAADPGERHLARSRPQTMAVTKGHGEAGPQPKAPESKISCKKFLCMSE